MRVSSRIALLRRRYRLNHVGPRLSYLYVFPADRETGWLCDGNDTRGKAINQRNEQRRTREGRPLQ